MLECGVSLCAYRSYGKGQSMIIGIYYDKQSITFSSESSLRSYNGV